MVGTGSATIGSSRSASLSSALRLVGVRAAHRGQHAVQFAEAYRTGAGGGAGTTAACTRKRDDREPPSAAEQAVLRKSRLPRRPGKSHAADAPRSGILSGLRKASSVHPIAEAERSRRRPVRGQRLPGLRGTGLGVSRHGHGAQSLGGTQGTAQPTDESAAAAAVAERQFLAAVKHPNIVGIYNFVGAQRKGSS